MVATVHSATILGAQGHPVTVEVHVARGLPAFRVVGLPDEACRESRDRVRAAVLSSGLDLAGQADHGQPGPGHAAQGRIGARPGDRRRGARRRRAAAVRGACRAWRSSASSASTARFVAVVGARADGRGHLRRAGGRAARLVPRGAGRHGANGAHRRQRSPSWSRLPAARRRGPDPPDRGGDRGSAAAARPGRRPRPAGGPAGAGDRRRRRAPPAVRRPAGLGQDDARPAPARAAAAARRHRSRWRPRWSTPRPACTLPPSGLVRRAPFRAPHHSSSLVSLVGGGTATLRPGEASLQPRRRPVPGRARRVPPARARRVAPAAGGRCRARRPGTCQRHVAGPLPARRGHEPVPVRWRAARRVQLRRGDAGRATCVGCPARCSTASTCASACTARRSTSCCRAGREERTATVAARVAAARARAMGRGGDGQRGHPAGAPGPVGAVDGCGAPAACVASWSNDRLSGRGYHRIRRVARTIADLEDDVELVDEHHVALALAMRVRVGQPVRERAA